MAAFISLSFPFFPLQRNKRKLPFSVNTYYTYRDNMLPFQYIYTENVVDEKQQHPFVCCKQKTEMANFCFLLQTETEVICFPWSANN
jgi:hypothetical protein